jgi:putative transposase
MAVGPAETLAFWKSFIKDLIKRGLDGVELVISDAREGLKSTIAETLSTSWQNATTTRRLRP